MIKIEKEVPMPLMGSRGRKVTYPFASMEVGDSFYVSNRTVSQIASIACNWVRKHNPSWKFITKTEESGVRIWRYK